MRIKRLKFLNCLGIEELAITPGKVTRISGGNEKGKTSILESIEKVLSNTNRREKFVRMGSDKAVIELETDTGLTISRTIKEDQDGNDAGSSVKVMVNGKPVQRPQSFLDELFGITGKKSDVFAFNPVDFLNRKDKDQTDILLGMIPIEFSLEDATAVFGAETPIGSSFAYDRHGLKVIKALEKFFYDARWAANGRVKSTSDEVAAVTKRLPDNYDAPKWDAIKLSSLYDKLRDAQEANQRRKDCAARIAYCPDKVSALDNALHLQENEAIDYASFKLSKVQEDIDQQKGKLLQQIGSIDEKIAELEKQRGLIYAKLEAIDDVAFSEKKLSIDTWLNNKMQDLKAQYDSALSAINQAKVVDEQYMADTQEIDLEPLEFECRYSEEMKTHLSLAKELKGLESLLTAHSEQADRYDSFVQYCRNKPAEMLSKVTLPVEGLGINDEGIVTINNLPIKNLSTSKQVRVCLDIARAYAKNTALKLICVDKMEHLDESARAEFFKQVENDDEFQYFTTLVTEGKLDIEPGGNQ